jgi:hypothetical protein
VPGQEKHLAIPNLRHVSLGDVRLEDPRFYLDDPFPIFAECAPRPRVFRYEPLDTFVLTKHEDIRLVNRNPAVFSNARGSSSTT